ncbi:putative glycoside hydrolase [Podospora aff. communis PSN243]|uniref:Probable alpha/beta-glucosidase agdC n=1 Tax=Podospora aff. communis PSN243 TaxID=3040156 RepID=A0AAV9G3B7_9PEZI|nr:putative glycoside hydrolase [Podospora aff. communis PSN243]
MALRLLSVGLLAVAGLAQDLVYPEYDKLSKCPGYKASNVKTSSTGLTATLTLAGAACNVYGDDLKELRLEVSYETDSRLHVKIQDPANNVYQVPASVFPRPSSKGSRRPALKFEYKPNPFSFSVRRASTNEILFDTSAAALIFESQYLRLRTKLPENPNLYGLGEHSDPFRLKTSRYVRTLWSQDSFGVPDNSNLYGNHPVYFEHRKSGSHGVFFLNSNGMDVVIDKDQAGTQYLEYNTLGGVLDFYFFAGPSPVEVARQYAEVAGLPAMMPYWSLGFHQCRYGYRDAFEVAEVVHNYSVAGIPLETMWTDIDYMDRRRGFSLDPQRFPKSMMRGLVDHLHSKGQKYILMVNPSVAYQDYEPFHRGVESDIFLKRENGSIWKGVVWPGVVGFPDWFHPNISKFWNNEFDIMFNPETGVDIDGLWIDMNEPSNFPCFFPCDDPDTAAIGFPPEPPPVREPPRALPGWPAEFQPGAKKQDARSLPPAEDIAIRGAVTPRSHVLPPRQESGKQLGLPGRDLLYPKYAIYNRAAYTPASNALAGGLSNKTVNTDVRHHNSLAEYDVHNLYGSMMSTQCAATMSHRRPALRPFVITRSTFSGAGRSVGKWLGDNYSSWWHYRLSIRSMLAFTSIYQMPMVGADVCGFAGNTTEDLCARWAMLGAFAPFYRNHVEYMPSISQEFYRWEVVAAAAKKAIEIRYRLLDYIYTALERQSRDGTPSITPVWFAYPGDEETYGLEEQYFYGEGLLVAPVVEEGATSVEVYLPRDVFYDWYTGKRVEGQGRRIKVNGVGLTDIPLYLRGGVIVPVRTQGAMTTDELRERDFELVVPVGKDGSARGRLYVDDGVSVVQKDVTDVEFKYSKGKLTAKGKFGFGGKLKIKKITVLGKGKKGKRDESEEGEEVSVQVDLPLTGEFEIDLPELE